MTEEKDSINITIIDRVGNTHPADVPMDMGLNVMEVCKALGLPVEGTCGGIALCASCHCYILSEHELPEPSESEEDMLDQAFFVEENSRLACQIKLDETMEGLVVKIAPVSE